MSEITLNERTNSIFINCPICNNGAMEIKEKYWKQEGKAECNCETFQKIYKSGIFIEAFCDCCGTKLVGKTPGESRYDCIKERNKIIIKKE